MGTPLPPNESENVCTICWGPGRKFETQTQPRWIWASVSNITPGEFWENSLEALLYLPHLMIQQAAPCFYVIDDGTFTFVLAFQGLSTEMRVNHNATNRKAFFAVEGSRCATAFKDIIPIPDGSYGFGGGCLLDFHQGN